MRENLQTIFLFLQKLIFAKKPTSHILQELNSKFCKRDILPVAVTFCMRLKKAFTRLARDLTHTIQKFKIFTGIKLPLVLRNEQKLTKFEKFNCCKKLISLRYFICWVFHFPWFLCIVFSCQKMLVNYKHANKFDIITVVL